MYKKLFIFLTVAALTACTDNRATQESLKLNCQGPVAAQNVRNNIHQIIQQEAQRFIRNDSRQFIDEKKVTAASERIDIFLNNITKEHQNGRLVCKADLIIDIPTDILNIAQTNSPLLYSTNINQLIQERTIGSPLTYDNGHFLRPLYYTTADNNGQITINYTDNALTTTAQNVTSILLPYGIKNIITINGRSTTLEDALQSKSNRQLFDLPNSAPDIIGNKVSVPDSPAAGEDKPQLQTPETPTSNYPIPGQVAPQQPAKHETQTAGDDLIQARHDNLSAEWEIETIWNNIAPNIQKELETEQYTWLQNKNNTCQQAADKAESIRQAEILHLQCDTRMIRERSHYLQGYTIN